jgi:hypothetical protein
MLVTSVRVLSELKRKERLITWLNLKAGVNCGRGYFSDGVHRHAFQLVRIKAATIEAKLLQVLAGLAPLHVHLVVINLHKRF